jgi:hypothetical protein
MTRGIAIYRSSLPSRVRKYQLAVEQLSSREAPLVPLASAVANARLYASTAMLLGEKFRMTWGHLPSYETHNMDSCSANRVYLFSGATRGG